jgi:SAM-dependent methyltransferase
MTTKNPRRRFLQAFGSGILLAALSRQLASAKELLSSDRENSWTIGGSNFHAIYDNEKLRNSFLAFLQNVFSIFPAERFHSLITEITRSAPHDKDIYLDGQNRLSEIKPFASEVRHALPALFHQTKIVGQQLQHLLEGRSEINGYMEIGSKGGYIAYAKSRLNLKGDVVLLNTAAASYGLGDIFERRGVIKVGRFVGLNDYAPISEADVKTASLDVVCNPIGFHHSPPDKRDAFVRSIRRCLREGGNLIVRDHDVDSPAMNHMVALAHDVFNMGLKNAWDYNQREIRNFTSLNELSDYLVRFGFRPPGQALYQDGDPTQNALISFIAV